LSANTSENNKEYLLLLLLNIQNQICSVDAWCTVRVFINHQHGDSNLVTRKTIVNKYGAARANCSLRNTSVHATFFCKGVY